MPECQFRHRHKNLLLAVLLFALVARVAGLLVFQDQLSRDVDQYQRLAETLRSDQVLGREGPSGIQPTAFRPPLYPLLLALTSPTGQVTPWQVATLHLLLGLATVFVVWQLSRNLGESGSLIASLLVAVDPILVYWSAHTMTETLATLLACLLLLVFQCGRGGERPRMMFLAGVIAGLAILCRPTFLAFAGLAWLLLAVRRQGRSVALLSLALVLVLMPWIVRNQRQLGKPVPTTTHGGYTLLLGNNPLFYEYLRSGSWGSRWDPSDFDRHLSENYSSRLSGLEFWESSSKETPRNEVERDRFAYQLARESIAREPGMFAWSCLVRLGRLWSPLAHQVDPQESTMRRLLRYLVAVWYLGILGLAGLSCWHQRHAWSSDRWCWGLLMCAAFSLVHLFYWSNMRMRAPLMPVVALLAAHGLAERYRKRREESADGAESASAEGPGDTDSA